MLSEYNIISNTNFNIRIGVLLKTTNIMNAIKKKEKNTNNKIVLLFICRI